MLSLGVEVGRFLWTGKEGLTDGCEICIKALLNTFVSFDFDLVAQTPPPALSLFRSAVWDLLHAALCDLVCPRSSPVPREGVSLVRGAL